MKNGYKPIGGNKMIINPLSYEQIKELMNTEDGIIELLDNCLPVFEEIDNVNKDFLNNDNLSFVDYDRITKKLTGCIMFLKPISAKAESYRHNTRHDKFIEFKKTSEKGMTGEVLKSMSQIAVKSYYDLVTTLDGYIGRSYCGIKDCERQNLNKKWEFKKGINEDGGE